MVLDQAADLDQVMYLARKARSATPPAHVIVTGVADQENVGTLVDAGVRAFVMRDASPDDLIATSGTLAVDIPKTDVPSVIVVQNPRDDVWPRRPAGPREVLLTPREQQVVQLIVDGMGNKEIAAALGVATHTVKSHVHNALQKLSVGSRLALAALVRQQADLRKTMSVRRSTSLERPQSVRVARWRDVGARVPRSCGD